MPEHVTQFIGGSGPSESRWFTLPPDLLDQVRGRVRTLALIFSIAFAFDPLTFWGLWGLASLLDKQLPLHFYEHLPFQIVDMCALAASLCLLSASRRKSISARTLVVVCLLFEVAVCFIIAYITMWSFYEERGVVPPMTWVVGVIILYPLIIPGPPRLMLAAALASASTPIISLLLLESRGHIRTLPGDYSEAIIPSVFAVIFAYMGARVIYGLGRQVAEARALGSYQLEERLGEGGMGEVWRARHRMLARPAAVKLIRPSLTEHRPDGAEVLVRRFELEARAIARLRSPHTVELFDFGVASNGAFYYAMELLEGLDADTLVRRFGPLPAERVIFILKQICHSLSEAESCGLVHRDIKPANIFLCRYGEDFDFVKVLDFGLVKALDEAGDNGKGLTRDTVVQGTPAFIAPEQAMGMNGLDSRVDIYATGCVAYWLLTGQLVFTADSAMALIFQHANTQPTPPSARSELPIPEALDRLILSCLAKNPAERPQTARELARRLAQLDGVSGWSEERARSWWEIHQPIERAATVAVS